jgi:hypothetical protein
MIAGSDFGDNLYNAVSHHPEVANLTSLTLESSSLIPITLSTSLLTSRPLLMSWKKLVSPGEPMLKDVS